MTRWADFSYTPRTDAQARDIAHVSLMDGLGKPFSFQDLKGQPVVVLFGYMSCPDVCPTSLAYLRQELDQLGADRAIIQPVFVSVDAERDKPDLLERYVQHFGADLRAVTGTEQALRDVTKAFGAYFQIGPKSSAGDGYLVSHSSNFYLLDRAGRVVGIQAPPHERGTLAALMTKILKSGG